MAFDAIIDTAEQEVTNKSKFLLEVLELNKLIYLLNDDIMLGEIPVKFEENPALNEKLISKE